MTDLTPFAEVMASLKKGQSNQSIMIPHDWGNGRTTYGGLSAAIAFQAARNRITDDRAARAVLVSFVGPVAPGTVSTETQILREGGSVTHVNVILRSDNEIVLSMLAAFGTQRPFEKEIISIAPPKIAEPDPSKKTPFMEGFMPPFMRHLDQIWMDNAFPFSGTNRDTVQGWVKLNSPPENMDEAWIIALNDAWPSPIMTHYLPKQALPSSLTWNLDFVAPGKLTAKDDWYQFECITSSAAGGYAQHAAKMWDRKGSLCAVSSQVVTVYEKK